MNSIDVLEREKSEINHIEYHGKYTPKERGKALKEAIGLLTKQKELIKWLNEEKELRNNSLIEYGYDAHLHGEIITFQKILEFVRKI